MKIRMSTAALLALVVLTAAACGGASDDPSGGDAGAAAEPPDGAKTTVSLVAYSTPEVVYKEVIPAFQKTPAGQAVGFETSFGASGQQSRSVADGLPADVVSFSAEPDMTRLVDAGLVAPSWKDGSNHGLVTTSVVTFVVRKGNPKNIRDWADLLRPGVEVLTPNPFTSGAAKWNLLAAYGQASDQGADPAAGLAYLRKLISNNVKVQDKSGREALQNFISGNGDVLLSYENEAVTAQREGEDVDYVIPDDTLRIDIDIAATEKASPAARKFLDYVLSEPAQRHFAQWGYRPVNRRALAAAKRKFPDPPGLFTIDDLGGWPKVDKQMFDPENGSIARIEEQAGLSSSG